MLINHLQAFQDLYIFYLRNSAGVNKWMVCGSKSAATDVSLLPLNKHVHAMCVGSYPCQQALWWSGGDGLSVGPLGCTQLWRHGGRLIYEGQGLRAVLRLAVLRSVSLVAVCVVVKVCRTERPTETLLAFHQKTRPAGSSDSQIPLMITISSTSSEQFASIEFSLYPPLMLVLHTRTQGMGDTKDDISEDLIYKCRRHVRILG